MCFAYRVTKLHYTEIDKHERILERKRNKVLLNTGGRTKGSDIRRMEGNRNKHGHPHSKGAMMQNHFRQYLANNGK